MQVDQDRPEHAILYAVFKWSSHDGAFSFKMHIDNGPLQFYQDQLVRQTVYNLRDDGYVRPYEVLGHTVGYRPTEEGAELLSDLGLPGHYDHD